MVQVVAPGAPAPVPDSIKDREDKVFELFDANRDDRITKAEVVAYAHTLFSHKPVARQAELRELAAVSYGAVFDSKDVDKDGAITREDLRAIRAANAR